MVNPINTETSPLFSVPKILINENFVLSHQICDYLKSTQKRCALITDETLAQLYQEPLATLPLPILTIPSGEKEKSRDSKALIEDQLFAQGFGKDSTLIAMGGGVITDLVGFVAATFCRGIDLIFIPTTLLGMVDASIGSKVAINTPYGKNLIGSYYTPKEIWTDLAFLNTLPSEQMKNGIVEMIKIALISSPPLFGRLLESGPIPSCELIEQSIHLKQMIVEDDPFETKGQRHLLNFGHTMGHAIETLSDYSIDHGKAVAMGILTALYLGETLGITDRETRNQVEDLFKIYSITPSFTFSIPLEKWLQTLKRDKKAKGGSVRFILIERPGIVASSDLGFCIEVSETAMIQAIKWMHEQFFKP